ncbi:hypothetical protein DPMN_019480 [Dreissena polymorpha]|uniref:Uncharacterized protein n=1 Tax=Dreissena polymorpha TaxID=45954 RepID=A0A9D4S9C6_DREPO|nr:hypothetical protein DPMN_019480 [Dreissena polymorpha]
MWSAAKPSEQNQNFQSGGSTGAGAGGCDRHTDRQTHKGKSNVSQTTKVPPCPPPKYASGVRETWPTLCKFGKDRTKNVEDFCKFSQNRQKRINMQSSTSSCGHVF